jgi:hypothetical protein
MTDAEIFTMIGRAIFPGDDWPSRFGAALDLPKQTVRDIRRDHVDLLPEVAADMLSMIERRATETAHARDVLRVWLKKNQPEGAKLTPSRSPTKRDAPRRD